MRRRGHEKFSSIVLPAGLLGCQGSISATKSREVMKRRISNQLSLYMPEIRHILDSTRQSTATTHRIGILKYKSSLIVHSSLLIFTVGLKGFIDVLG